MKISRRKFIERSLLSGAGLSISSVALAKSSGHFLSAAGKNKYPISVFSKNLQWLGYKEMAEFVSEMGFDGIDITVRPDGHVLPQRVADDLPKVVEIVRKAGLRVDMITTAIQRSTDPYTEAILKTAASLDIRYYRMGWLNYDDKKSISDNLKVFRVTLSQLAALNKKHKVIGQYQNHSGLSLGAAVWDLSSAFEGLDPASIGFQYDIMHATVEGANVWPHGLQLCKEYVQTMDIKDFAWTKKAGRWIADLVPLGEGMVDYKKYLSLIKQYNITGPFSMHFEYPIGGAEHGHTTISISREEIKSFMKRDLLKFREMLTAAEISG